MRHIKHEKECFSRIKTPRSRIREQGQADLYFDPINLEFQDTLWTDLSDWDCFLKPSSYPDFRDEKSNESEVWILDCLKF